MTNATEKLRALLDERGVNWYGSYDSDETCWDCGGLTWLYLDDGRNSGLGVDGADVTPEQAIAATLGERTCHDRLGDIEPFECSECFRRNNDMKFPNYCWYCGAKVVK